MSFLRRAIRRPPADGSPPTPPDLPSPGRSAEPGAPPEATAEPSISPDTDARAEPARPAGDALATGLGRTRGGFVARLRSLLGGPTIDDAVWDEIEEALILGDVGPTLAAGVVERGRRESDGVPAEVAVRRQLRALLVPRDEPFDPLRPAVPGGPAVVLVVGVNGSGKTTTIGKLAHRFRSAGARVLVAAADTFRAAAIDQLVAWARRAGAEVVSHAPGSDPGAVVYDALDAAVARGADVVVADTAGRLHTRVTLMDELAKIRRVVERRLPGARPEVLLVLDATTGQNGLAQATAFAEAVGLTGVVLTKLDSTAKGGIVFAIEDRLRIPVRYVGVGEGVEDLVDFDPDAFVEALFR
ncbi:MAG TPA: signal recognition particle-docking protein FtsY [Candidatus Binatia bacterium]|nr:signal recognition particle-docking protein FtsY [Candidatus Binatia bacterium]